MSVRNLDALFSPGSVAVVGVSARPGNVGRMVFDNLRAGGFEGPLWAVGRQAAAVGDTKLWPSIESLPAAPELAVICTPPGTVPGLIDALVRKGAKAAIVVTAGLKQRAPDGERTLEQAMLEAARSGLLRIIGGNCIGVLVPGHNLNASFAPSAALPGGLAFVTQSGALATAMLDWANSHDIGFSHFISLGDSADVDFGDMLDYLASDGNTRAILLYMESVKHARKFMSAARAAARNKPVILVKSGRAPEGARAAASHTGAMAGSDEVFDVAVRRAGMLRVDTLAGLFDAAETLAQPMPWCGERLVMLTNGGGAGVLAADALSQSGGRMAVLSAATLAALNACLPPTWSHGNPVDIIGDAPVDRYRDTFRVLLAAPEVDGILFMHAPTAIVSSTAIAQACLPLIAQATKPVLTSWIGGELVEPARRAFRAAGLPTYPTPESAVSGWMQLVHYQRNQAALLELPRAQSGGADVDRAAAEEVLAAALAAGQEWLDPTGAAQVLTAYGIPTVATARAADAQEAARVAAAIGFPVALKVISQEIVHKSDVGGVVLDLDSAEAVEDAAERMRERIARAAPQARIAGFTVQAMAIRPGARELIVGIATDDVFGPVVLFGAGGTSVEVQKDSAMELPPLTGTLAAGLVARTRVGRLLEPHRGKPGANKPALYDTLMRVSRLASDLAAVAELDINPLLVDTQGVLAVDARIRVRRPPAGDTDRMALRPYPAELEEHWEVAGRPVEVRPIRPEDGDRMEAFYAGTPESELHLRFFFTNGEVPRNALARYCQIDYDREMAFIVLDGDRMVGEVRAVCDPDNVQAQFAIQVAPDWQRKGLGRRLLGKMTEYLGARGVLELSGRCLRSNTAMAGLAAAMGFRLSPARDDAAVLQLQLGGAGLSSGDASSRARRRSTGVI